MSRGQSQNNPLFGSRTASTPAPKLSQQEIDTIKRRADIQEFQLQGGTIQEQDGYTEWIMNGLRHRENGPALESSLGGSSWYRLGDLHRSDGPAIQKDDGTLEWFVYGQRHRVDGPAIEWSGGDKEWFIEGQRHREDGPAVLLTTGLCEYWQFDKLHREDGPAVERKNGQGVWYWQDHRCEDRAEHESKKFDFYLDAWQQTQKQKPFLSMNVDEVEI